MARTESDIDMELVSDLASLGCTDREICAVVGISKPTLYRRCREAIDDGRERGKASIRRKQFEVAMKGNTAMLIWLGKQLLGQVDKQVVENQFDTFEVVIGAPKDDHRIAVTESTELLGEPGEA